MKEVQHSQVLFALSVLTKPKTSVGDDVYHDSGY